MIHLYQNIGLDDQCVDPKRKHSKFWNEGKWENYIVPFLPSGVECRDQTFVDVGCNAGLFLKLARQRGFRDVIGVEEDKKACERAEAYRKDLGLDYKILHRSIGKDFSFEELPVADFTLLSNVHYYWKIDAWLDYLDQLQYKTVHCLVITRHLKRRAHWRASGELDMVRNYFKDWEEMGAVYHVRAGRDPSPRVLWALLFRSKLRRKKIADIRLGIREEEDDLPKMDLIEGNNLNPYFKALEARVGKKWSAEQLAEFVQAKVDLIKSIKKHGMKKPVIVQLDNKLIDGEHRLLLLKELGYNSIITRII
jgi:SAM-dependent methyltransferase